MRVILAFLLTFLIASAQCQQAITLENCLYDIGVLAADLSLVYRNRGDRSASQKARADLQTLFNHCSVALPNSLGDKPVKKTLKKLNKKINKVSKKQSTN